MEEKKHVYVPVSLAKKIKELENSDNFVLEYIEQSKREILTNFEVMDEEIVGYKANMIKARKEFEKAKNEMISANYEVWDKLQDEQKSLTSKARRMAEALQPLKSELEDIKKLMDNINTWRAKDLLSLLEAINSSAANGETRNMMKFLMENYETKN